MELSENYAEASEYISDCVETLRSNVWALALEEMQDEFKLTSYQLEIHRDYIEEELEDILLDIVNVIKINSSYIEKKKKGDK